MSASGVLRAAASDIGYVETPVNHQKFGVWYGWDGVAWCDMAVSYWAAKAGESTAIGKFAGTQSHAAWFRSKGQIVTDPRPGDLVFYAWSGGGFGGIDHVGVIERVLAGGLLQTIEGNTSRGDTLIARRAGGGVLRMIRTREFVACFARPAYKPEPLVASRIPATLPHWYRRVLQQGSNGSDVAAMQKRFNQYGGKLTVDGDFGPKTKAIVQRTQHNHRLVVDGVVGPHTAAVIGG